MKKILILGTSNSCRPPLKCWPEWVAEHFPNIQVRNAALRGITPDHIYDEYKVNEDWNPDLVIADLPPWYRFSIPVATETREIEIDSIIERDNYSEVIYKSFKGVVPIGGYIPPEIFELPSTMPAEAVMLIDKKQKIDYAKWLQAQQIPNSNLTLYDAFKRRAENRKDFDTVVNFSNDVRLSSYYRKKAAKDLLLFESAVKCPYKYIHTIGPFPFYVNEDNFLTENPFHWVLNNFEDYSTMFEDEWAHFTEEAHEIVAKRLYIPAIEEIVNA